MLKTKLPPFSPGENGPNVVPEMKETKQVRAGALDKQSFIVMGLNHQSCAFLVLWQLPI
jgi:hypothetical protein